MTTFETILLMLLVVDAVALGALVLLQQGKGADVGAAFGSGSSNTVFGSAGSTSFLTKVTVWLALGFFLIAFGLAYTARERAANTQELGVPQLVTTETAPPAGSEADPEAPQGAEPEQLTPEPESVDSDIPDV